MECTTCEISTVCRFCLCQDDLIPISQATDSLFTIEDIVHFTGIQITDEEQLSYAMCYQCCQTLESSIAFRSTCQGNDFVFKQMFTMLIESVKDDLEEYEDSAPGKGISSDNHSDGEFAAKEEPPLESNCMATSDFDPTGQTMVDSSVDTPTHWPEYNKTQTKTDDESSPSEALSRLIDQVITEISVGGVKTKPKRKPREIQLCAICGKIVRNLNSHIKNTHVMEKKYSCPHCQIVMRHQANMWKHINAVHKKKIIISCEQCGKGFTHKNSYTSHMISAHGLGTKFECKICSRTFNQRSSYGSHMERWHLPPKELACKICNKIFKEKVRLKYHQRVHSTDQPYACSRCPKRFKSLDAKKNHEITHTGVRFTCKLCEKSYGYKTQLSSHYRKYHEGMIPGQPLQDTSTDKIADPSSTID